jgi:hypothetical protein
VCPVSVKIADENARISECEAGVFAAATSGEAVAGDDLAVEVCTHLRRALLRGEVDIVDAKAIGVTVGPLEVIH